MCVGVILLLCHIYYSLSSITEAQLCREANLSRTEAASCNKVDNLLGIDDVDNLASGFLLIDSVS